MRFRQLAVRSPCQAACAERVPLRDGVGPEGPVVLRAARHALGPRGAHHADQAYPAAGQGARQLDRGEGFVGVHRAEDAVEGLADQPQAQRQHVARVLQVVLLNRLLVGRLALWAVVCPCTTPKCRDTRSSRSWHHLGHKGAEARVQPQPCSALCVSTSTASAGKNSASSSGSATPGEVRVGALGRCCVPERAAATGAVALGRAKRDVFRGQHRLPFAACAISYGLLSEDLSAAR
eukprot:scaffold23453_cov42-Phaeocystis_antarctica.AAC.1